MKPHNDEYQAPEPCPYEHNLSLDHTHESWALGRICNGCARPVRVVVEHV